MKNSKKVGDIVRGMSDLINWTPSRSKVYTDSRYTRKEKVVTYRVKFINFAEKDSKKIQNKLFAELTKEGYPIKDITDIFVFEGLIRIEVRYPINEITLK